MVYAATNKDFLKHVAFYSGKQSKSEESPNSIFLDDTTGTTGTPGTPSTTRATVHNMRKHLLMFTCVLALFVLIVMLSPIKNMHIGMLFALIILIIASQSVPVMWAMVYGVLYVAFRSSA